ncbi:class I SAM-dependent methyltransferase [Oceaniserpentilla sp. 4NH20-0058]|uniref:class I SAM-dependent methyltransferase n=1 Tax=Oceaniserpentilla sp. 4NH20-0058 TaxID=3127660 RepID=UPI003104A6F2
MENNSVFNLIVESLPSSQAKRLVHGRGGVIKGWEQINIEVYPPVLWVMVYQSLDETDLLKTLNEIASQAQGLGIEAIYIQRRFQKDDPVEVFYGSDAFIGIDHRIIEDNLSYWVNLGRNQNTGLFLDMSEGRAWVKANAQNKHVLNLFSYTCSLGITAAAGYASSVVNIDMAKGAIKRGQQNLALNDVPCVSNTFIAQDIFKMIKKLTQKGPYDLLIADPPSFQSKAFDVRRDYEKLLTKLKPSLAPNAQLMLCLNSPALTPDFLHELVERVFPQAQFITRIKNPPVLADQNEEHSLKVMLYQLPA